MGRIARAGWALLMGLGLALGMSGAALAGAFQISPLRLTLSGAAPIAVMTVHNGGLQASVMQLNVMAWSQTATGDDYQPTADVLVTPPIFSIPPGGTQIVRLGLRRQPDARRELAYRLFLQEVPSADKESAIKVVLRFGIPIFLAPDGPAALPLLEWHIVAVSGGALRIEALNRGDAHAQMAGFAVHTVAGGAVLGEYRGTDYLLPEQTRQWTVRIDQAQPPGTLLNIVGRTDAGAFDAQAQLEH